MLQCKFIYNILLMGRYCYAGAFDRSCGDWDLCCTEVGYDVHNMYFYSLRMVSLESLLDFDIFFLPTVVL